MTSPSRPEARATTVVPREVLPREALPREVSPPEVLPPGVSPPEVWTSGSWTWGHAVRLAGLLAGVVLAASLTGGCGGRAARVSRQGGWPDLRVLDPAIEVASAAAGAATEPGSGTPEAVPASGWLVELEWWALEEPLGETPFVAKRSKRSESGSRGSSPTLEPLAPYLRPMGDPARSARLLAVSALGFAGRFAAREDYEAVHGELRPSALPRSAVHLGRQDFALRAGEVARAGLVRGSSIQRANDRSAQEADLALYFEAPSTEGGRLAWAIEQRAVPEVEAAGAGVAWAGRAGAQGAAAREAETQEGEVKGAQDDGRAETEGTAAGGVATRERAHAEGIDLERPLLLALPWPGPSGPELPGAARRGKRAGEVVVLITTRAATAEEIATRASRAPVLDAPPPDRATGAASGVSDNADESIAERFPDFRQELAALRWSSTQRRALAWLAERTGAPLSRDFAVVAPAPILSEVCLAVRAMVIDPRADQGDLGGWLDRAALAHLAEAGDELDPGLRGLLVAHTGEVAFHPATLSRLSELPLARAALERRLSQENQDFLEDPSPVSRVRAFDWLVSQGQGPPGYDPLASRAARRAALDAFAALRAGSDSVSGSGVAGVVSGGETSPSAIDPPAIASPSSDPPVSDPHARPPPRSASSPPTASGGAP